MRYISIYTITTIRNTTTTTITTNNNDNNKPMQYTKC